MDTRASTNKSCGSIQSVLSQGSQFSHTLLLRFCSALKRKWMIRSGKKVEKKISILHPGPLCTNMQSIHERTFHSRRILIKIALDHSPSQHGKAKTLSRCAFLFRWIFLITQKWIFRSNPKFPLRVNPPNFFAPSMVLKMTKMTKVVKDVGAREQIFRFGGRRRRKRIARVCYFFCCPFLSLPQLLHFAEKAKTNNTLEKLRSNWQCKAYFSRLLSTSIAPPGFTSGNFPRKKNFWLPQRSCWELNEITKIQQNNRVKKHRGNATTSHQS